MDFQAITGTLGAREGLECDGFKNTFLVNCTCYTIFEKSYIIHILEKLFSQQIKLIRYLFIPQALDSGK